MTEYVFERSEKKYLLDRKTLTAFMDRIKSHIAPSEYCNSKIRNIYFDTDDDFLVRSSNEKPVYKEKLRMRCYGVPDEKSRVFLEIKRKVDGTVCKRRTALYYKDAEQCLTSGKLPESTGQIGREIEYFIKKYNVKPKLYMSYDRKAYVGAEDKNLRLTVDTNIVSRSENVVLGGPNEGRQLLPEGYFLMEIKTASVFPLWLSHTLSELGIYPTSFSKYGSIYKESVRNGEDK